MKNLKTIITLFVLTMTMFSCQTNDELVELESFSASRTFQEISINSFVFIVYERDVTEEEKQIIRGKFELQGLSFINIEECNNKEGETWELGEISYLQFQYALAFLGYIDIDPTLLTPGDDEEYPDFPDIETQNFTIKFNADCNGAIN